MRRERENHFLHPVRELWFTSPVTSHEPRKSSCLKLRELSRNSRVFLRQTTCSFVYGMEETGKVLWTASNGLQCILVPFFGHVQLRLMRDTKVVRTEVFAKRTAALAASRAWRRLYTQHPHSRPA